MKSLEELKSLRERAEREGAEAFVGEARRALESEDRNVRVAALRLLAYAPPEEAAAGLLRGLCDPARRVREVAVKSSRRALSNPGVAARLREMAEDEGEKRKIRERAFEALFGAGELPESAGRVLSAMAKLEKHRDAVLFRLAQLEPEGAVLELLRDFVKNGTREQAVTATRALCGFKIVNLGSFSEEERRRIARTYEPAAGRVWYWVPRAPKQALG